MDYLVSSRKSQYHLRISLHRFSPCDGVSQVLNPSFIHRVKSQSGHQTNLGVATSENWCVQQEAVLPGQESEAL